MKLVSPAGTAPDTNGGTGSARRALWTMLRQACSVAALAHAVFLLLFAHLGMPVLVWSNLASIALFFIGRALLVRRRNGLAVLIITAEIVLHAVVASALLGWDSGFHYYLLTLIGPLAVGMRGGTASQAGRLVAFGAGYVALDAWTRHSLPVYTVDPMLLASVRYFNVAGMLAIMAFVTMSYYRVVVSADRALRRLASTDPLTGLYNRRRLLEIVRAVREGDAVAPGLYLLLCDIDHFKQFNDQHGHETGDLVLERVAAAVTSAVRATDSVARWGGEEFVVLLPGADGATAMQTGERVRAAVAAVVLHPPSSAATPRRRVPITITIGIARVDPGDTIDAAIARADAALYRGKAAGRDRVIADGDAAVPSFVLTT